jgi:5-methylcytosine-specific restriction protein A
VLSTFIDSPDTPGSAHTEFQAWRSTHRNGFVLNLLSASHVKLHRAGCGHFGDTQWRCSSGGENSLTNKQKICADDVSTLLKYASAQDFPHPSICQTCSPNISGAPKADSEWTSDELRASVCAYLEMRRRLQSGEHINKAGYYRALAMQYGRSEKAFEYRMCNISYVLSVQGRAGVPGLLPRSNVGAHVAHEIERLLAIEEKHAVAPSVSFEIEVKKNRKSGVSEQPKGNQAPKAVVSAGTRYERDAAVKAWVLENANGVCECCEVPAPFVDNDGFPYLEVHHIRRLADGGADTVNNAVAVCPNCHRHLHHGREAVGLVERLRRRLKRLIVE